MFDIAITGGTIVDPVGKRLIPANVYVMDGKIAEISRTGMDAIDTIDASGMYVAPGFIDIHSHAESNQIVGEMLARQGVTTVIGGNCGLGQLNLPEFFEKTEKTGFIINQMELVGATKLRERVGQSDPYAHMSEEQIKHAEALLQADLETGASGLSFGLEYAPGSSTEEIERLAAISARYGKPVAVHIRTDCWEGLSALKEAIDISRKTGAGVIISHVVYQFGYGMMRHALEIIDEAIREGIDISCDSGMYTSFATFFGSAVFDDGCLKKWGCSYDSIFMTSGKYAGQYLTQETFKKARKECYDDIAIAMIGNPHEILAAFELPYMMCSSDSGITPLNGSAVALHPQDAGTFAKFLRETVILTHKLTLVDAVSRITSIPAERMKLQNKGRLVPGADADIAVFELDKVRDCSEFPDKGKADTAPEGFRAVIVGGKVAVSDGKTGCVNAGKIIRSFNNEWKFLG